MEPSNEELKMQLALEKRAAEERKISNETYAAKIVERVVYGVIALAGTIIVGLIIKAILHVPISTP